MSRLEHAAGTWGCDRIVLTTARRQSAAVEFYVDRGYERLATRNVNGYELLDLGKDLRVDFQAPVGTDAGDAISTAERPCDQSATHR